MMNDLNKIGLPVLCLTLAACGSSGSDPTAGGGDNNDTGGNYQSSYCVDDDVTKQSDDAFVVINAFSRAPDIPESILSGDEFQDLGNTLLYSSLSVSTAGINIAVAFGPIFAVGLCDAEISANNSCDFTFGDLRTIGNATATTLNINLTTKPPGSNNFTQDVSRYNGDVSPYWQGSYILFENPTNPESVESTVTWRREALTEFFDSTSVNGDYLRATENSDCSGTLSRRDTKDGVVTTIDGSWQISGTTTTGEVMSCKDGDCVTLSW